MLVFHCISSFSNVRLICHHEFPSRDLKIMVHQDYAGTRQSNPDKNWEGKCITRMGVRGRSDCSPAVYTSVYFFGCWLWNAKTLPHGKDPSFCCLCIGVHKHMLANVQRAWCTKPSSFKQRAQMPLIDFIEMYKNKYIALVHKSIIALTGSLI